jgi:UDP-GlcNAc:undecaprenyl-phosphate GlcNAc-1-phosphate transferase
VLAVPVLVLAVPIFDTLFVTIQRLIHRQHPFVGGTDHVSHRLAVLGLSTRQAVLAMYWISGCLGVLSVVSVSLAPLPKLAVWLSVLTILMLFGSYLARVKVYRLQHETVPGRVSGSAEPTTLIATMLVHKRRVVEILVDFCLISSVYVAAHLLRYEGTLTRDVQALIIKSVPFILAIKVASFAVLGLYRGIWRYMGLADVVTVFKAVTLGSVLSALALLYLWRFEGYSRAVLIIDWTLSFLAIGGARVAERLLDEWVGGARTQRVPTLIIGAGDTGARVLRSMKYEGERARRPVGLLDDDARKHGNRIHGTSVLGSCGRLSEVLDTLQIREVLIAIIDPPGELLQHVQRCCEPRGVAWRVVTAGLTEAV